MTDSDPVFSFRFEGLSMIHVEDAPPRPRYFSQRLRLCKEGLHQAKLGYACPCGRLQPK